MWTLSCYDMGSYIYTLSIRTQRCIHQAYLYSMIPPQLCVSRGGIVIDAYHFLGFLIAT